MGVRSPVSGILFGGTLYKVIEFWESGKLDVYYTSDILGEYSKVLSYPKFKLPLDVVADILVFVTEFGKRIKLKTKVDIIKEDPFDNIFLECAIDGGCQVVITGDKHLLGLKEYRNIKIVTPRQFFSIFKSL